MNAKVEISIIIVNYNTFKLTCQCIESVIENADKTIEIVLVDNASTEKTPMGFNEIFPEMKLIKSDVNLGFSKGNNLGIFNSTGELILLLNSDTILKKGALTELSDFLSCNPQVAAVSGRLEYPDGVVQHNCQRFPSIKYQLFELLRLQKILPKKNSGKILFGSFFDYSSVAYPDWIWGTCFMFRRGLLDKLSGGKLPDDLFMYGEDMQWCMEFRKLGYKVAFQPSAKVIHFLGKSGGDKDLLVRENMNWIMEKYYCKPQIKAIQLLNRVLYAER